ncbi:hypothetical protein A0H81_11638 [Grifola frondosa]|uniref:Uncharacterized protein n=1 Tax=Grifola frondosa TaxID=5627 RepID=A0A1C7LUH2_GRIFR|nr:hypothetical protein A0H81_11638 [Grifola frondosa]
MRWGLLVICKDLKAVALPLYYARVRITSLPTLAKFTAHLHDSDQKWDSIRRIPYSTPGRWVQCLDLSDLQCCVKVEVFRIDALLTQLFPLLPLMTRLILNTPIILSRRALTSLACRDGISNLRVLMGVHFFIKPARRHLR